MVLNFASAKNPGRWPTCAWSVQVAASCPVRRLRRSRWRERRGSFPAWTASGITCALTAQRCHAAPRYAMNRRDPREGLYSDDMIFSPLVPFFREDRGDLRPRVTRCSVITAPAPNAGVAGNGKAVKKVLEAWRRSFGSRPEPGADGPRAALGRARERRRADPGRLGLWRLQERRQGARGRCPGHRTPGRRWRPSSPPPCERTPCSASSTSSSPSQTSRRGSTTGTGG